jgi:hypothetical protein
VTCDGVSIAGLQLQLQATPSSSLTLSVNGTYGFPTPISTGSQYAVVIVQQPSSGLSVCNFLRFSDIGTVSSIVAVSPVAVYCGAVGSISPTPLPGGLVLGGTISGLGTTSGYIVELAQVAGAQANQFTESFAQDGAFNFLNLLPYNAPYDIKIRSNPTNRQCFLQFNTGVIRSRTSNLLVQCAPANNCISNSDPQQGCSTGTFCSKQNRCLACNLCDINVDDTTPRNFSSCALACASPTSPSLPWWKQSMWIAGFTNMCMCDELFFLY